MVSRVLPDGFADQRASLTILDPACGDGAFVLPLLDHIASQRGVADDDAFSRLKIVHDHVYGVDSDAEAIHHVRRRVSEWIGDLSEAASEIERVVSCNFPCGDALLGNDWSNHDRFQHVKDLDVIDWKQQFPTVAATGGFDLVIGNPPYRRERDSKADFDRIAQSPLGRWREPRMDLWHYFLHRGLELLKPGGRLQYIVNSYWTRATSARCLRQRVAEETTLEEVVMLGAAPLFRGVSGQHMIFRLCKHLASDSRCHVHDLSSLNLDQIKGRLSQEMTERYTIPQADLWKGDQRLLQIDQIRTTVSGSLPAAHGKEGQTLAGHTISNSNRLSSKEDAPFCQGLLGDFYDVRQGIAENPPFVTRKAAIELGDTSMVGRGVFVLTDGEVKSLRLNAKERALLRPYYALSAVERFRVASLPTHQLLYLTRQTAPTLDEIPHLARHLEQFRPILDRRREVQSGQIAWWHLHWPREERLFTSPRILSLQMGETPRFAYAEHPTYVGFSMHVITASADPKGQASPSLPALTAILNSSRAQQWFESHAKHRGAHLDISGTILKQFPLPMRCQPDLERALTQLTQSWPKVPDSGFESQLDQIVDSWYSVAE